MESIHYNSVLGMINIQNNDKVILVKETGIADSNFILTHLMKQIFSKPTGKLCLICLHNMFDHYVAIGKRLGYNLENKLEEKSLKVIEPLKSVFEDLGNEDQQEYSRFMNQDEETIIKYFYKNIESYISEIYTPDSEVYLIIDDLSHLIDLNIDYSLINIFINYCVNINGITSVFNLHVANRKDEIISKSLEYIADVVIDVLPLKTGRSADVSGVVKVARETEDGQQNNIYHYKAYDRGIKTFRPGEHLRR